MSLVSVDRHEVNRRVKPKIKVRQRGAMGRTKHKDKKSAKHLGGVDIRVD